MRKLLIGFIIGALVCGSTTYAYQMLNVSQVNYTVMANGKPVTSEKLNYNGRTYIEMRETAEILGASVGWDEGTRTASVTSGAYVADMPMTKLNLLFVNGENVHENQSEPFYIFINDGKLFVNDMVLDKIPNLSNNEPREGHALSYFNMSVIIPKTKPDYFFVDGETDKTYLINFDKVVDATYGKIYYKLLNGNRVLSITTTR